MSTCACHLRSSDTVTPSNHALDALVILMPFAAMSSHLGWSLEKRILSSLVLSQFRTILLLLEPTAAWVAASWSLPLIPWSEHPSHVVLSSTYLTVSQSVWRSLIWNRKVTGPMGVPCGTVAIAGAQSGVTTSSLTRCCRPVKKDVIQLITKFGRPSLAILDISTL